MKRLALLAALLAAPAAAHAGGFGAGFGQGIGQQFGGMPAQPYYYIPPSPPLRYQTDQMFYPQQQRYTFPNGSLNCTTFQGAFGTQTTCR